MVKAPGQLSAAIVTFPMEAVVVSTVQLALRYSVVSAGNVKFGTELSDIDTVCIPEIALPQASVTVHVLVKDPVELQPDKFVKLSI